MGWQTAATDPADQVDPLAMAVDETVVIDGVEYRDVGRAGGGCTCRVCGKLFYDHRPFRGITDNNGNPFLTLLCGGVLVKL
jgi:hypothetical protein